MSEPHDTVPPKAVGVAAGLMWATYVAAAVGFFMYFYYWASDDPSTAATWLAALVLGAAGLLSFVRHSVFHKADAARLGWDIGRRNNFQIEVGFANLAWGVVGLRAVFLSWSTQTIGALTLVFGIYMTAATVLHLADGKRRGALIASACFAVALWVAGVQLLTS